MEKVCRLGTSKTFGGRGMSIYVSIKFVDGKLSISGVEGPLSTGNCLGSCGQINMSMSPKSIEPGPGWTRSKIRQLLQHWDRWHLNDMKAGTEKQENALREAKANGWKPHYTACCQRLHSIRHGAFCVQSLLVDDGYRYGTAWLTEAVPQAVIDWLFALPDTDKKPAWV